MNRYMEVKDIELDLFFLILLTVSLLISSFFVFNGALEWDEGSFLMNAEYFSGDDANFEESRPAALSFLISVIWMFTGESVAAARLLVMLFGAGASIIFYLIASKEFEEPLIPAAVFLFSPLLIYWSSRVYTDVPGLFLMLGALYAYRKKRFLASGILISLATTVRYIFFVFAAGMGISFLIDRRSYLKEYVAGGILGVIPFFTYSWLRYGSPVARIEMYIEKVSQWSGSGMFAATIPNLAALLSILSGLIPLVALGWRNSPLVDRAMIITYTLFMLLFSGNTFTRYWLAVLPLVILVAYRGSGKKLFAAGAALMILTSGVSIAADYQTNERCMEPLEEALDYTSNLEGKVVSDSWAASAYYLDRKVHSPWTSLDQLHRNYSVQYAVISEEKDYPVLEKFSGKCRDYYIYDISIGSRSQDK